MTLNQLGRYEIIGELGKGAMGLVYLARDPLIGRQLALKTFRLGFSAQDADAEQFRARFLREAQSAGILSHPNIVTIHDVVVEDGGDFFIAMEYVKGTDLKQLMQRQGRLDIRFVVDIVAQIAEGLDYAHSKGVVHRDIKPANIIITADKQAKITDFGIARVDASNLTVEGQLLGTPNYMAPEQIQGKEVDHRADIFSLGVMLYEMITGKKPFQGDNLTMVTHRIVYDAFTPPQELVAGLPDRLVTVLQQALEKDASRRYSRGSEMARDLKAVFTTQGQRQEGGTASFLSPPTPQQQPPQATASTSGVVPIQSAASMPYPVSGNSGAIRPGTLAGVPAPPPQPPAPAADDGSGPRRMIMAAAALLVVGALGTTAFVALRPTTTADAANATQQVDPEAELRSQYQPLVDKGKQAMADGEPVRAVEHFDQALVIMPGDKEIRSLREEAEKMILDGDLTVEEAMVRDRLRRAESALLADRYDEAIAAAQEALELAPDDKEGQRLLAEAEDGKLRLKSAKDRVKDRFSKRPVAPTTETEAPSNRPIAAAEQEATLKIDFFSQISDGSLTVFVGPTKFFTQKFSFTKESGGLIKRQVKSSGRLTHSGTLTAGEGLKIRTYVWRNGATKTVEMDADLPADSTRTLEIRVGEDGGVATRIR